MTSPINVGILGLGQRGLQHLNALWKLQSEGQVKVCALIDAFEENLAETKLQRYVEGFRRGDICTSTDFNPTLADVKLDALYFAIPPGVHNGELIRAANAGVHIFAEKPMSLYLDEAVEMERAIRESGVIATAGFQQRHDPRYEAVQRFLADKQVVMLTFVVNIPLEAHSVKHTATEKLSGPQNRVWTANVEWSGTSVVEAGIHQVDLMRYWCGDIAWVQADYVHRNADDIVDGGDNPYAYSVKFGFESGAIGNFLQSRLRKAYYSDGYQNVLWTHGHIKFEGNDVIAYYYDGPYPPQQRPGGNEIRHLLPVSGNRDTTLQISRAFIESIATGKPDSLRNTFTSSMNSLAAVLGANISDRLGGERVYLRDLFTAEKYAPFRRKPGKMA